MRRYLRRLFKRRRTGPSKTQLAQGASPPTRSAEDLDLDTTRGRLAGGVKTSTAGERNSHAYRIGQDCGPRQCQQLSAPEAFVEEIITQTIKELQNAERMMPEERQSVIDTLIAAVDITDLALGVADGSLSQESPLRGLLLARNTLLCCLSSLGIQRVDTSEGYVDLVYQEIALVTDVGDKELDARVAGVIRAGYRTEKGIVRQALVRVYRYNPAMANQEGGQ